MNKTATSREIEDLYGLSFDVPASVFQLFDAARIRKLVRLLNGVKENADRNRA